MTMINSTCMYSSNPSLSGINHIDQASLWLSRGNQPSMESLTPVYPMPRHKAAPSTEPGVLR